MTIFVPAPRHKPRLEACLTKSACMGGPARTSPNEDFKGETTKENSDVYLSLGDSRLTTQSIFMIFHVLNIYLESYQRQRKKKRHLNTTTVHITVGKAWPERFGTDEGGLNAGISVVFIPKKI